MAMTEWRCTRCNRLLGIFQDGRLHIQFARGHKYLVGVPATSVCRSCQTLNETHTENERTVRITGSSSITRD